MPEKLQQLNENFLYAEKFPYDFVCIQRKIHDARKKRELCMSNKRTSSWNWKHKFCLISRPPEKRGEREVRVEEEQQKHDRGSSYTISRFM